MALRTRLLGDGFAVEVEGVDLAALDDAAFRELRETWMRHKVAVLRGQNLDDDALVSFTARLGPLFTHIRDQFHAPDRHEVMYISNLKEDGRPLGALGDGDLGWHSDQSYTPRPVFGTLLYAIEVPSQGGDTWFGDLAAAYAAMPEALRAEVVGRKARYSIDKATLKKDYMLRPDQRERAPDQWHPLVRTHPYLDRKALYLSPDHMVGIDDLSFDETECAIERLLAWAARPEFLYRHEWRVGDVVLWDNTSVMHRRDAFPPDQRRFLKRTGFHLPESLAVPF